MKRASPRPLRWLLTVLSAAGLILAIVAPATFAQEGDPPGNNGTVKIDGVEFDDHPDNEPHPGCSFQVDFYNYDEGDLTASVLFEGIEPTGGGVLLSESGIDIGEDPAGGGQDLDATRTYDLSGALAEIEPHPQQGYHVKLTVEAEGSIGADVKHKVFWVDCPPPEDEVEVTPVSLVITKVEQGDTDTTLPDADFDLYLDDGDGTFESGVDSRVGSGTTGSDGTLTFSELDPNETYFVVETDAPDNYEIIGNGVTVVEIEESNASVTVENAPITEVSPTVSLTVTKVEQGDNDNTLAGATFELYADDGDTSGELDDNDSQHGTECTTGDDGVCAFSGLSPNSTYFLVETQAPDQYEIVGDGVRTITTGEEGVSETVPNAAITDVRDVVEERPDKPAPDAGDDEKVAVLDEQVERQELARTGTETNLAIWAAALLFAGAVLLLLPGQRLMTATASRSSRRTRTNGAVWTAGEARRWSAGSEAGERNGSRIWGRDAPR